MALHFKRRVKLLEAVLALSEVAQIQVMLLLVIQMTLNVCHDAYVVIKYLVAVPTLESDNTDTFNRMTNKRTKAKQS